MAHRYSTRSTTPTPQIDFSQPLPRGQTRPRIQRRHASNQITTSNPPNEQRIVQERTVETYNNSVHTDQQVDVEANKVTTVPCFNISFSETPEVITCSICLEALSASREPMATICGHIFCLQCLSMSLKKRKRCPTCQSAVKLSTSIRLYF